MNFFRTFILALLLAAVTFGTVKAQDTTTEETISSTEWIIAAPPRFELLRPSILSYDATIAPGARIFPLRLREPAPIAGILLNAEANAWLISQFEHVQQSLIIEMNRRVDLTLHWGIAESQGVRNRCDTETAELRVRIDTIQAENDELTRTAERLIRQNRRQRMLYRFLLSGSAVVFVAATTTAVVVVSR